jgi:sortase A
MVIVGSVILIAIAFDRMVAASSERAYAAMLERLRGASSTNEKARPPESLPVGEPIGTLELVRVGLSGVVVEGDEDSVLDVAIGHLPDTPLPWQPGNSALAAHRDALFRPLKDVKLGDTLRLKTPHGDFDYRVRETIIVKPKDLWVLDPTSAPTLTLISCWPFNYIGSAPERFIVRAERILQWYETDPLRRLAGSGS